MANPLPETCSNRSCIRAHIMATANNSNNNLNPPWKPGQSGNPSGRPKGTRHLAGYVLELMAARSFQMPWCPSPGASCPTYRCMKGKDQQWGQPTSWRP